MAQLNRPDNVKFLKGCLPQDLLGSFLNALFQSALINKSKYSRIDQGKSVKDSY